MKHQPVAVKLNDGTILAISDLPPKTTTRWVASTKASVVKVYMAGLIAKEDAIERYGLSVEEFDSWVKHYIAKGKTGLKATKLQTIRAA